MNNFPECPNFPESEKEVIDLWDRIDAFGNSVRKSKNENRKNYTFYDGPPFATGLPHYGHLLASTIKDICTRYAHQNGYHVVRRFGWDCHGLPIEFQIDQELGINTKQQIVEMGIPKYNDYCRSIVMRFSKEWEIMIKRLGRWVDFKNDYKTMDVGFMESVWWGFSELFQKGLVYRGFKVMPYSPGCTTPLSNFEAGSNYKESIDPSIFVKIKIKNQEKFLLIWTTTPWTLQSNLAICVHPDYDYVELTDTNTQEKFIVLKDRIDSIFNKNYKINKTFKGNELCGTEYEPLFEYLCSDEYFREHSFRVVADKYVGKDQGTGLVHMAPIFGEDDMRVCLLNGIICKDKNIPDPLDDNCRFKHFPDCEGIFCKETDKYWIKQLKSMNMLYKQGTITHPYPFCWRSETPLIYRAVPSWFVAVEKIKEKILVNSKDSSWVPEHVQNGRFHNWLKDARDWAVSRNRFWGTPIPIWISDDGEEIICIGSIKQLYELSGVLVTDLHREHIDHLIIPSQRGSKYGVLKRVESVFDCWFESGSMPYAQLHYPFENMELFEESFPADFIAEGLDQTRGWFYTLLVLSSALFDSTPFKHVIVNGLILASDGKKMSKRLKNYPDPSHILDKYGADILRMYLINSPVVKAEPLKFKEEHVRALSKDFFIPWYNAFRFLCQNILRYDKQNTSNNKKFLPNIDRILENDSLMDKWIMALTQSLIIFVKKEMESYRLYTVVPRLIDFIKQLTNWYVRLNRTNIKNDIIGESLNTLFWVILTSCRIMSPFTPFLSEWMFGHLKELLPESMKHESIHWADYPEPDERYFDQHIQRAVHTMQYCIENVRDTRLKNKLSLRMPLKTLTINSSDENVRKFLDTMSEYIKSELNVQKLEIGYDVDSYIDVILESDRKILGKMFGKESNKIFQEIENLNELSKKDKFCKNKIKNFLETGKLQLSNHCLEKGICIKHSIGNCSDKSISISYLDPIKTVLIYSTKIDKQQQDQAFLSEFVNRIQKLRKKCGLTPINPIYVVWNTESEEKEIIAKNIKELDKLIGYPVIESIENKTKIIEDNVTIGNVIINLQLFHQ
jgi:isoleucyl-tRNA synthetase